MKKGLLSILLVVVMLVGALPISAYAGDAGISGSQTGEFGTFVDGKSVIQDMVDLHGTGAHPRLIMSDERFAMLKSHIGDGSVTAALLEELRGEADRHLREDPAPYDAYGEDHLLETSKRIQRRVAALAMAYNIFGDEKYAKRCYKELEKACSYPDWSPKHFLDTAEMCTAFAYGYDWLYNWMTPDQRTLLRTNMIEKGLKQVMQDYKNSPSNRPRTYKWYQDQEGDNWQLVCTGGTNLVALAIGDEAVATDLAAEVLTYGYKRAYSFVRRAYSTKDGTYIEGLGYWDYATYYLGLQSSALISATGSDYGLADYEGIRKSVEFVRYMSSNTPKSFSFGDDRESRDTGWAVFLWLGKHLNSPETSAVRLRKIEVDPEFNYLDVLWIDESKQYDSDNTNDTDWGSVGACNASFRTSWDESGLVAALHVGENYYKYHGHYDLGSFYIESNGSRFFTDLGNESYSLTNRQFSYRIKAEGHNTLVINPTKDIDQREGANCLVTNYQSGNEAFAVTDLTDAYSPSDAKSVVRGLKMIKDKNCVIIQDEIALNKPGEIYWFAHTKGQIKVASDGRSAVITVGSDKLWVGLLSSGGKFTEMEAKPLSTSLVVSGATSNSDYRKLAIHLTNTQKTTISVACIPLKSGSTTPSWKPSSVSSISSWGVKPTSTPTPASKPTSTPTPTPKPTSTPTPKPTSTPTPTPKPTSTPTPTPKPTSTPTPTPKPTSTPTHTHTFSTEWKTNENYHWHECSICGAMTGDGLHYPLTDTTKATLSSNGKIVTSCRFCDKVTATTIYYPKTFTLSAASYTYDGKAHMPTVTVTDSNGKTVAASNYTVSYTDSLGADISSPVEEGTYKVKIDFKGNYSGSKTIAYEIRRVSMNLDNNWYGVMTSWTAVPGYEYALYRTETGKNQWTLITRTDQTYYYDQTAQNDGRYTYAVALVLDGKILNRGEEESCHYMTAPVISSVENIVKGVTVKWNTVSGSAGYYVYRKEGQSGTWRFLGSSLSTSFTDKSELEPGAVYYYAVKSFANEADGTKTLSASSSARNTVFVKNSFVSSFANQTPGALKVTYSKSDKASGYEIVYCPYSSFSAAYTKSEAVADGNTYSKTFAGLKKETTYYVKVRAYRTVGEYTFYSPWSAVKNYEITK